ncbi:MAG: hypothetical protein OEY51_06885 [Cyclobacteriaceae bacterium]|nr:hypothetical protein [Cyclobacteriaceae bacterium]
MNIQTEKLELMRLILETNNPKIIESIKKIFKKEDTKDFWFNLSSQDRDAILAGMEDDENGDVIDYNDFISKHKK